MLEPEMQGYCCEFCGAIADCDPLCPMNDDDDSWIHDPDMEAR
jgi:hypothetical protein